MVPVRFARACPKGHIGDIDWYAFVHDDPKSPCRRTLWLEEQEAEVHGTERGSLKVETVRHRGPLSINDKEWQQKKPGPTARLFQGFKRVRGSGEDISVEANWILRVGAVFVRSCCAWNEAHDEQPQCGRGAARHGTG